MAVLLQIFSLNLWLPFLFLKVVKYTRHLHWYAAITIIHPQSPSLLAKLKLCTQWTLTPLAQAAIILLSVSEWLLYVLHTGGVTQYLFLCDWLISLWTSPRLIHIVRTVACAGTSFLRLIFQCGYISTPFSLYIHLSRATWVLPPHGYGE